MIWQSLWFVLAGFVLGFIVSTLWEWYFFRRERLRLIEHDIARATHRATAGRGDATRARDPEYGSPHVPYDPDTYLQAENPEPPVPTGLDSPADLSGAAVDHVSEGPVEDSGESPAAALHETQPALRPVHPRPETGQITRTSSTTDEARAGVAEAGLAATMRAWTEYPDVREHDADWTDKPDAGSDIDLTISRPGDDRPADTYAADSASELDDELDIEVDDASGIKFDAESVSERDDELDGVLAPEPDAGRAVVLDAERRTETDDELEGDLVAESDADLAVVPDSGSRTGIDDERDKEPNAEPGTERDADVVVILDSEGRTELDDEANGEPDLDVDLAAEPGADRSVVLDSAGRTALDDELDDEANGERGLDVDLAAEPGADRSLVLDSEGRTAQDDELSDEANGERGLDVDLAAEPGADRSLVLDSESLADLENDLDHGRDDEFGAGLDTGLDDQPDAGFDDKRYGEGEIRGSMDSRAADHGPTPVRVVVRAPDESGYESAAEHDLSPAAFGPVKRVRIAPMGQDRVLRSNGPADEADDRGEAPSPSQPATEDAKEAGVLTVNHIAATAGAGGADSAVGSGHRAELERLAAEIRTWTVTEASSVLGEHEQDTDDGPMGGSRTAADVPLSIGARAAPTAEVPGSGEYPDNLSQIKGIGRVYCTRLHEAGIFTWHQLANTSVAELRRMVNPPVSANVEEWPSQAQKLAEKHGRVGAGYAGPIPDDLSQIRGIGRVAKSRLYAAGIYTFQDLATALPDVLAEIVPSSPNGEEVDYARWLRDARRLADAEDER